MAGICGMIILYHQHTQVAKFQLCQLCRRAGYHAFLRCAQIFTYCDRHIGQSCLYQCPAQHLCLVLPAGQGNHLPVITDGTGQAAGTSMHAEQHRILIGRSCFCAKYLYAAHARQNMYRSLSRQLGRQGFCCAVKSGISAEKNRSRSLLLQCGITQAGKRNGFHVSPQAGQSFCQTCGCQHPVCLTNSIPCLGGEHVLRAHACANQVKFPHTFHAFMTASAASTVACKSCLVWAAPTNMASNCAGAR